MNTGATAHPFNAFNASAHMSTYEETFGHKHVARIREMLATATQKYEDLDFITHEGVTSVTITLQSDSKTLTLRLPADAMHDLCDPLHSYQGRQVERLEAGLTQAVQEWGEPTEPLPTLPFTGRRVPVLAHTSLAATA